MDTKPVNIRVNERDWEVIRKLAKDKCLTVSAYIRLLVSDHVKQHSIS